MYIRQMTEFAKNLPNVRALLSLILWNKLTEST